VKSSCECGNEPSGSIKRANLNHRTSSMRSDLSKGHNRVGISASPHLRMDIDPVSETLCFLVFGIPGDGQGPQSQ
jgi:hypothetical protein